MEKVDNEYEYDNKCAKCDTWSVSNNMTFDVCGDHRERWFTNYECENCGGWCCVSEEDDWNRIKAGETINFDC